MQAIETVYNGYRFRSRLEARWAVFFDVLGMEYTYEPEGFEFEDGTKYLPDFFLPGSGFFFEVKPYSLTEDELQKVRCLDNSPPEWASGCSVLIGPPEEAIFRGPDDWEGNTAFLLMIYNRGFSEEAVRSAVLSARQARFEHGQVGGPQDWD